MPYIQTVHVAGLSAPETEKLLASRFRAGYLRNPSVSVQVTTSRPFFILGEVNTAGSYPYAAQHDSSECRRAGRRL